MNAMTARKSPPLITAFEPLAKLSPHDGQELLRTAITATLSAGTPIFQRGENDRRSYFLLAGEVELSGEDGMTVVTAGSEAARQPLDDTFPRRRSAVARTDVTLLSFDADMLEMFLSWTSPEAYHVEEMESTKPNSWMSKLLRSRGLRQFPAARIHTLLDRLHEVQVRAGEIVVAQDGHDDDYYIIKKGHCVVTRRPDPKAREIKLAELGEGDAFGEEALLAGTPRGATVTMTEDGALMKLSRSDFAELMASQLLRSLAWPAARALMAKGAVLLDVRMPDEFGERRLPGSINIPLSLLRLRQRQLDMNRRYIICSNDGNRAAVAAFLLNQRGFDAYLLDGGINALRCETVAVTPTPADDIPVLTEPAKPHPPLSDPWHREATNEDTAFADSQAVTTIAIGKTAPLATTTSSTTATKPARSRVEAMPPVIDLMEPSTARPSLTVLRVTLIAAIVGAAATALALHFGNRWLPAAVTATPPTKAHPAAVVAAPAVPPAAPATEGPAAPETAPWIDAVETGMSTLATDLLENQPGHGNNQMPPPAIWP